MQVAVLRVQIPRQIPRKDTGMSKPYLPGLAEQPGDSNVEVTSFQSLRRPVTVTAKWWMRPICWLTRKPTTRTVYR